jgi:hypothetical protein
MSKKKLMDGYFDQFKNDVADINPHIEEMIKVSKANDSDLLASKTQPERRHRVVQNVEIMQNKRSQEPGQNVDIKTETQPERRHKAIQNVEITQPERRHKAIQNVDIKTTALNCDPTLLVGTQRLVFKYLFELTQKFASLKTPRLTLESMSASTGLKEMQVHSATKQLRQKGCIAISDRKDGRGGWVEYSVIQHSFEMWIRLENNHKRSQNVEITQSKRSQEPGHKAIHEASCSSSDLNINNINTTTQDLIFLNIPKNLQGQLPLNQLRSMLKSGAVDELTLEDSLWGFSHDLEKGLVKSKSGNTTGLFMGALRNGGYISQQYLSQKQSELLEIKGRVAELKKITEELRLNDLAREFESYRSSNPELAEKLKPSGPFIKTFDVGSMGYRLWLEEYKKSTEQDQKNQNENEPSV